VSVDTLLRDLTSRGVLLAARGSRLVVDGPSDALSDRVVEELRALKPEILSLLSTTSENSRWDAADWQAYGDERAAVREHDGGLLRGEAERLAFEDTVAQWLCLHPAPASDPQEGCAHCGGREWPGNSLLAVLAAGGHLWVHDTCWRDWQAHRRRQASMALQRLGLAPAFTHADVGGP
jgi:hypothetical protein